MGDFFFFFFLCFSRTRSGGEGKGNQATGLGREERGMVGGMWRKGEGFG